MEIYKRIAIDFFYHWWNTRGNSTEEGFDNWWEKNGENYSVGENCSDNHQSLAKEDIFKEFAEKISNQKDIDPEIQNVINQPNFFKDLLEIEERKDKENIEKPFNIDKFKCSNCGKSLYDCDSSCFYKDEPEINSEEPEIIAERLVKEHPDFQVEGLSEYMNGYYNGILKGIEFIKNNK